MNILSNVRDLLSVHHQAPLQAADRRCRAAEQTEQRGGQRLRPGSPADIEEAPRQDAGVGQERDIHPQNGSARAHPEREGEVPLSSSSPSSSSSSSFSASFYFFHCLTATMRGLEGFNIQLQTYFLFCFRICLLVLFTT